MPLRVGKRDDLAFPARGRIVGLVQLRQLQPVADLSQHGSVDVFDGDDDGCAGVARSKVTVRADGHRRDDCGSAAETLDDGGEAAGLQRIWRADDGNRAGWGAEMPAQEIENGRELYRPVDSGGTGGGASALIFDPIGSVHHHDHIVVEKSLQPIAGAALHPLRIVFAADGLRGVLRLCNAVNFLQHARRTIADRLPDQLLFAIERDLIRPSRRRSALQR